jgi:methanogenic corrinoid protein MtbC1
VFSVDQLEHLQLVTRALALGHRPAQVVAASPDEIRRLLEVARGGEVDTQILPEVTRPRPLPAANRDDAALRDSVARLDGPRLTHLLLEQWALLAPIDFLEGPVVNLLTSIGEDWRAGRLGVRHEHFLTARLSDLLGALRQPLERDSRGPAVVLATLPGEGHTLGLAMVALLLANLGFRTLFLGAECPVAEVAAAVGGREARAVAISVSASSAGARMTRQLRALRRALPQRVPLLLGGAGAPKLAGTQRLASLRALAAWARAHRN